MALIEISHILNTTLVTENNVTTKRLTLVFEELCLGTFVDEYTIISSRLCVRIDENPNDIMTQLNKLPKYLKQFEYDLDKSKYFYTAYYGMSSDGGENIAGTILRGIPFKKIFIVRYVLERVKLPLNVYHRLFSIFGGSSKIKHQCISINLLKRAFKGEKFNKFILIR